MEILGSQSVLSLGSDLRQQFSLVQQSFILWGMVPMRTGVCCLKNSDRQTSALIYLITSRRR